MKTYSYFFLSATLLFISCNPTESEITPLTNFWDRAVPYQEIPKGLSSLSAQECGQCHQEHYQEWKTSTHSQAWTDRQFQSEIKKDSSPRMCINCHIPLENQQEHFVLGYENNDVFKPVLKPNPQFDYKLQQEGITCAACHVRDNAIVGPNGNQNAPHPVILDKEHLSEQLCINCHNAVAVITPTLACSFETGDEWKAGPYPDQNKNCKSCHMPVVHRPLVSNGETKTSHYHNFAGSGIPKSNTHHPEMLQSLEFNVVHQEKYSRGDSAEFAISLKNSFAGHRVPTGDPERFILINFTATIDDLPVDSITFRIGEHWEWYPEAKKITDNNLNPLEERVYKFNTKIPHQGKLKIIIEVTKHRSTIENLNYNKISLDYPIQVTIFEKIIIPYLGD